MKKMKWVAVLLLAGTLAGWAYQPAGWLWFGWPYGFDSGLGQWVYFQETDTQWCYGMPPASGWQKLGQSGLAAGWSWHAWPYAYDFEGGAWYYINQADKQWCFNMATWYWTVLGQAEVPADMPQVSHGSFQMGDALGEGEAVELPVHTVFLSTFFIDRHEVSKALWDEVYNWAIRSGYRFDNSGLGKATNHPVHTVSWYDAVKWCNARSEMEGLTPCYYTNETFNFLTVYIHSSVDISNSWVNWSANGYRLPTEAEWEKEARRSLPNRRFPWSTVIEEDTITHAQANYYSDSSFSYDISPTRGYHPTYATGGMPYTCPVDAFQSNDDGLHNLAGNVWEWCWDGYSFTYYATSPGSDPRGPGSGLVRVLRGGSWIDDAIVARVATRGGDVPGKASYSIGFRCVRGRL